jgi:putative CocE/NonD family hydrolase
MKKRTFLKIALPTLAVIALVTVSCAPQIKTFVIDRFVAGYLGPMPTFTHKMGEVKTYRVRMRDGTELDTRVHLPKGDGPWPTLLVRDPYQFSFYLTCHMYVRYGYACVHQDVRGHGKSEGDWYPLRHEMEDGEDTFDWLLQQDWQNRKIAMVGASYVGLVQWAMADRFPPEVKTIVASVSHGDFYSMVYRGGHFTQAITGLWSAEIFYPLEDKEKAAKIWKEQVLGQRPANAVDPAIFKGAWASYKDYINHPEPDDPYWQQPYYTQLRQSHKALRVPAFLVARWHDFFLEGMLDRFPELPARSDSLLMISPGDHGGQTNDLPYRNKVEHEFANSVAWLDHHLKGAPLPENLKPGYLYYLNGADYWTHADRWPVGDTQEQTSYLAGLKAANACGGQLTANKPEGGDAAQYLYDPRNPVPTRGGSFLLNPNLAPVAVAKQGTEACERADILSFLSDAYTEPARIMGSARVSLKVASDADDTAFTVKLSEVFEDGTVLGIRDDITSLAYRNGARSRLTYAPGDVVDVQFDLPPIDWTVQRGSRLRLDVSSSNSPAFPAHSNYAGLWSDIADTRVARQSVLEGSVTLPLHQQ